MGFFASFFNVVEGDRETAVLCPFPHHTLTGVEYLETHPSAHLNLEKNVFHCKVCNKGYSEASFIQELFGCSYLDAIKISHAFEQAPDAYAWHGELTDAGKVELSELGISETTATELNLNAKDDGTIEFPVQMYGKTVDVRAYKRGGSPKVRSQAGALSGYIIPFDQWQQSPQNKITLICAGEKDMAVARSHGFNAITFTGGEHPPRRLIKLFRGRSVVIVYDNDDAGKDGAKYLASALLPYAKNVKVCTAFHEICKENREDITDFFTKYGKTREDLIAYIKATPYFKEEDAIRVRNAEPIKNVTLYQAAQPENIGKILQANIQVVATADQTFLAPTSVVATKMRLSGDPIGDTLNVGEQRTWELKEDTLDGLFKLIDNNLTDAKISENLRMLMGIPPK